MADRLHIFGTCSGTEPMPGRHHCSFAVEHEGDLYWFDAGECCSYTAHLMGVDVRNIRSIFISHPHMDHVGGLGNLMWTIRKLYIRYGGEPGRKYHLYMPDRMTWPAIRQMLCQTEGDFINPFEIEEHPVRDGVVMEADGMKVSAMHNLHLTPLADGSFRSYSYRICVGGKVIVFSADVKNYAEIEPLLKGADVLLAETGHHRPVKVCRELMEMDCVPETLMFIHHGRAILDEYEAAMAEARAVYPGKMIVLNDGDQFTL